MAVHYRAQVILPQDTELPIDAITVNPCFRAAAGLSAPATFAHDVAQIFSDFYSSGGAHVICKVYDLQGTKPVYPVAVEEVNTGVAARPSTLPREIAVCLSFFGDHNRPSERGRLYIMAAALGGVSGSAMDRYVPTAVSDRIATLPPLLAAAGGPDIDWIVWSRKLNKATQVKNWFVDNEWDTVRTRGLKATSRTTGTTSG